MDFSFGLLIVLFLVYVWWLYSTKKVIKERHDWLQKELETHTAEKNALLDIMAHRAFALKYIDMRDDVGLGALRLRLDKRLAADPIFRQMFAVVKVVEDTDAETEWRKKWIE